MDSQAASRADLSEALRTMARAVEAGADVIEAREVPPPRLGERRVDVTVRVDE